MACDLKQSISAKENDTITRIFIRAMHTKVRGSEQPAGLACRDHSDSQPVYELVLNILQIAISSAKNVMSSPLLRSCRWSATGEEANNGRAMKDVGNRDFKNIIQTSLVQFEKNEREF
jgi:hypothetical protein